jgi:hypothetical protein
MGRRYAGFGKQPEQAFAAQPMEVRVGEMLLRLIRRGQAAPAASAIAEQALELRLLKKSMFADGGDQT